MPEQIVDIDIGEIFVGYGLFLLILMLAIIMPDLTHQHFNFSTFPGDVKVLSRYGLLSIAFGVLLKRVLGGLILNE